jgi:hypothetical protein
VPVFCPSYSLRNSSSSRFIPQPGDGVIGQTQTKKQKATLREMPAKVADQVLLEIALILAKGQEGTAKRPR